jgi:PBSX family phage terminase large subunit
MFISTPKGFNHFYDLYNKEATDDDYKSFNFTTYDNRHIPPEEVDKAKSEMTEDRFAQEFLADFRKTEGLVYKEFNRAVHLFENEPKTLWNETLLGIDFGFTNPTAMIFIKKDPDSNYYVTNEWYRSGQTNDQIAEVAQSFNASKIYPDPEAPEKVLELKRKGLYVMEVVKGADSVVNGINIVRELFKQNRLFIHKNCTNLILELETYSYDPDKIGKFAEVPIKDNDHALDALRYALMMNNTQKTATQAKTYYPNFKR